MLIPSDRTASHCATRTTLRIAMTYLPLPRAFHHVPSFHVVPYSFGRLPHHLSLNPSSCHPQPRPFHSLPRPFHSLAHPFVILSHRFKCSLNRLSTVNNVHAVPVNRGNRPSLIRLTLNNSSQSAKLGGVVVQTLCATGQFPARRDIQRRDARQAT